MLCHARRLAVLTLLATLVPAAAADVHVVDSNGQGDFLTIGLAIASASDGDLVLVRSGTYPGFAVGDLDVAIFEDAGAVVVVNGTVTVSSLPTGKSFVLGGLDLRGPFSVSVSGPALRITNAFGRVRLVDCALRGGDGFSYAAGLSNPGAIALEATSCFDFAMTRCTIRGGKGGGSTPGGGIFDLGGNGGAAVRARFTAAAFYECTLRGGDGGAGDGGGGNGARGYDHDQGGGGAYFSGCTVEGGDGGWAYGWGLGGWGGHALMTSAAAHHHLLGNAVITGSGGASTGWPPGANGQLYAGTGTYQFFQGAARRLASAILAPAGGTLAVTFTGLAGDRLFLAQSAHTRFHFQPASHGVWLLPIPVLFLVEPTATLTSPGTVVVTVPVGGLPVGSEAATTYAQGIVIDAVGDRFLTSPLIFQRLP